MSLNLKYEKILPACELLSHIDYFKNIKPGQIVARKFADVGFEEFLYVKDNTFVSLLNGKISEIDGENTRHLFYVPEVENIINEAEIKRLNFKKINKEDEKWEIEIFSLSKNEMQKTAEVDLKTGLLNALLLVNKLDLKLNIKRNIGVSIKEPIIKS